MYRDLCSFGMWSIIVFIGNFLLWILLQSSSHASVQKGLSHACWFKIIPGKLRVRTKAIVCKPRPLLFTAGKCRDLNEPTDCKTYERLRSPQNIFCLSPSLIFSSFLSSSFALSLSPSWVCSSSTNLSKWESTLYKNLNVVYRVVEIKKKWCHWLKKN